MTYRVILQRLAMHDLRVAYDWAAAGAPSTAARWLQRFQNSLQTLEHLPERCPLAQEHGKVAVDVREFLSGKRPYLFRVIFAIDGDTVRVLRIRRAQRRSLTRSELEQSLDLDSR